MSDVRREVSEAYHYHTLCSICNETRTGARWWCRTCEVVSLCDDCKESHCLNNNAASQSHQVVPLANKYKKEELQHTQSQSQKDKDVFCLICNSSISFLSIPKVHDEHKFLPLKTAQKMKTEEITRLERELQEKVLSSIEGSKAIMKPKMDDFGHRISELRQDIDTSRQNLKEDVDKISKEMKDGIARFEEHQLKELGISLGALKNRKKSLKKLENHIKFLENSDLETISNFLREESVSKIAHPSNTQIFSLQTPQFIPGKVLHSSIKGQIGALISVRKLFEHSTRLPPHHLQLEEKSNTTGVFIGNSANQNVENLCFEGTALFSRTNIETNFKIGGFAKPENGEFLTSDRENHRILRIKRDGSSEKIIKTGYSHPRGLLINSMGEIVVCLSGQEGQLRIYFHCGSYVKQDVKPKYPTSAKSGKVFMSDPQQIIQNFNGDYILINKNVNHFHVVCLSRDAIQIRWTFDGEKKHPKEEVSP